MPTLQSAWHTAAAPGRSRPPRTGGVGRTLVFAAVGPLVTCYLGVAALLALVIAAAPGTTLSAPGVLRAAGPAWLAVYHVPVNIAGHELGMLPLLPTVLALALVARSAANLARRLDCDTPRSAVRVIGAIGAAHAVFAFGVAMVCANTTVSASPVVAFFVAGIFAAVAATVGTARQCRLLPAALARADDATDTGLRAGGLAVLALAGVGAAVFAVGLLGSWSTAVQLFRATAPGYGNGLGMFLLSLAYLPNALIGALSFAAGPGFTIGRVTVAQWSFHTGAVPAVPVLAPMPEVLAQWWVFLMLLPVGVGVLVGLTCRRPAEGAATRLRSVGVAGLVAGLSWLVLAALAGGALAGGPFDPVTVPAGLLAVSVFLLVAVPGSVTVLLPGRPVEEEPEFDEDEFWDSDEADEEPGADVEPEPFPYPEDE